MAFIDHEGQWAGGGATNDPATKEDSNVWFDFKNGRIYYDTMGTLLINQQNFAPFGQDNGHADNPTNSEWSTKAATSTEGTITNFLEAANGTFVKRFGEDVLLLKGSVKFDLVSKTGVTHSSQITVIVRGTGIEESMNIPNSSWNEIEFKVDISSISDNALFTVEIHLDSEVTISSGEADGSTYSTESF